MERRPLRLRTYDYSSTGLYFVTICAHLRVCVFGSVVEDSVYLSRIGEVARDCLLAIPRHHGAATVDSWVVMPNHVHALIGLDDRNEVELGDVVGTFKVAVSRRARRRGVWQRGYYDHIVRDDRDLQRIREYIATNPLRWDLDPENPNRMP